MLERVGGIQREEPAAKETGAAHSLEVLRLQEVSLVRFHESQSGKRREDKICGVRPSKESAQVADSERVLDILPD